MENVKKIKRSKLRIIFFIYLVLSIGLFMTDLIVAFTSCKMPHRLVLREDMILSTIPFFIALVFSIGLFSIKLNKVKNVIILLVLLLIMSGLTLVTANNHYTIYSDWFGNTEEITGVLIDVRQSSIGKNNKVVGLKLDTSDRLWETRHLYKSVEYFEKYEGKEITIEYTPNYKSIVQIKSGGRYIYKEYDPDFNDTE